MNKRWYQRVTIQAEIIGGLFLILTALISSKMLPGCNGKETVTIKKDYPIQKVTPEAQLGSIQNNKLRRLNPLETGKSIFDLPDGVYGYSFNNSIVYHVENPKKHPLELTGKKMPDFSFEIQKLNNKIYVIGYIGEESYSNVGIAKKGSGLQVTLLPEPWKEIKNIVSIPLDSIIKISERRIDDVDNDRTIYALDLISENILVNIREDH